VLGHVWNSLWSALSIAQSEDEVLKALSEARPYENYFSPLASLILQIIKERRFPKRRTAQIQFVADSLAGLGMITPRRSRDVCAQERIKEERAKKAHRILRYEYYVKCSCGYKGPSKGHACAKCGAKIQFENDFASDPFE
jgi:hypothetical protein